MAFNIEKFFLVDNETYKDKGVVVYDFRDDLLEKFIREFLVPFRQAYISDEDLDWGVNKKTWDSKEEAIAEQIPTKANLRSGEFSEILLYYLSLFFRCPDANVAPLKWRWKENQNQPCHLSDIVLMKCVDENSPSTDDYMYVVESKAKAVVPPKNSNDSVMNDAIDGAVKDYISRSGKMIAYMRKWYNKEKNESMTLKAKRFGNSVDVDYQRRYNAAIVVDRGSLLKHMDNISAEKLKNAVDNGICLMAVPIDKMKDVYERVYQNVINS